MCRTGSAGVGNLGLKTTKNDWSKIALTQTITAFLKFRTQPKAKSSEYNGTKSIGKCQNFAHLRLDCLHGLAKIHKDTSNAMHEANFFSHSGAYFLPLFPFSSTSEAKLLALIGVCLPRRPSLALLNSTTLWMNCVQFVVAEGATAKCHPSVTLL